MHLAAFAGSVGAVAVLTAAIELFKSFVPVLSLGVLYVIAVLVVAAVWGMAYALPVPIASMLAFNWFHLPPVHPSRPRHFLMEPWRGSLRARGQTRV